MNPTGKAGKPRAKPPALKGKTQFQRFVETAKALEVDETGAAFERVMQVIAPANASGKTLNTTPDVLTPGHGKYQAPSSATKIAKRVRQRGT